MLDMENQSDLLFRLASATDEDIVFEIFKKSPTYFLRVDNALPTMETARKEITCRPTKLSAAFHKEFLILYNQGEPIGVAELLAHHPEENIAYIGLLLLIESLQRCGLGSAAYELLEKYCIQKYNIRHFRLGVSDDNDVAVFWCKAGFAPNGRTYEHQGVNRITRVIEYERVCL